MSGFQVTITGMAAYHRPSSLVMLKPSQPAARCLSKGNGCVSKATVAPGSASKRTSLQLADPSTEHGRCFPRAGSAERRPFRSRSVSTSFSVSGDTRQTASALTVSFEEQFIIRDPPSSSWEFDDFDEELDASNASVAEGVRARGGGGGSSALASPQSSQRGADASRVRVDISSWLDRRAHIDDKQMVVLRVLKAAMNHGSFDIVGHGVPQHVLHNLAALSSQFFEQPFDAKARLQALESDLGFRTERSTRARGNGAQHFSAITPLDDPANVRDGLDETFLVVLEEYSRQMDTLEGALLRLLAEALSLAKGVRLPKDAMIKAKAGAGGLIRCTSIDPSAPPSAASCGLNDVCSAMSITYSHRDAPESAEGVAAFASASAADDDPALRVTLGDMMNVWSGGLFVNGSFPCGTGHEATDGHIAIEHRTAEAGNGSASVLGSALPGLDES